MVLKSRVRAVFLVSVFAGHFCGFGAIMAETPGSELKTRLARVAAEGTIPGLAAGVLVDGEVRWVGAVGLADLATKRPMAPTTIHNVGSVSKLVTATAVVALEEAGRLDLDVDVARYLRFRIRNPAAPEIPITARMLLTHTSGISDTDPYAESYACGDPEVSLEDWVRGYLTPGGAYWRPGNFRSESPGTRFEYSNVGYGLLGLLVERIEGLSFSDATRRLVFEPIGMRSTGWLLTEVDRDRLATPYWLVAGTPDVDEVALLPPAPHEEGELVAFCHYSFFNYPDGLLRTTIEDLALFAAATQPGPGRKLLGTEARADVFRDQLGGVETDGRLQGLGWRRTESDRFGLLWGHGGADPGTRAHVLYRPSDGVTVVVIANRLVVEELVPVVELLFEEGARLAAIE